MIQYGVAMKVYFDYPDDATQARSELISMGVPEAAITLAVHKTGGTPVEALKRFAGAQSSEQTHGATMIVEDADWMREAKIQRVVEDHRGKIRTGEA